MITTFPTPTVGPARGLDAQRRVASLGHVLTVWAHPDDEAYLAGGLLSLAAANGQRTTCVTATAGERGTDQPDRWPPDRLAARRRHELEASLDVLGVQEHHWLDLPDGGCHEADQALAVAQVLGIVLRTRPDTIVTFGPDGITGHLDHRTVGWWASLAADAYRGAELLHVAHTDSWAEAFAPVHAEVPVFFDGHPQSVPDEQVVVDLELDDPVLDRKVAALEAHTSQTGPLVDAMGRGHWREWVRRESFVLAPRPERGQVRPRPR